jgi:toluene monooxygenase system ferredoxin subunit
VPFQKAIAMEELWSGEMAGLSIDGAPVLLLNIDGVICAYADWCPHQRSRLSAGSLKEGVLTCATHHWQFDVTTGQGINPKDACLRSIAVKVVDGEILVDASEAKAFSGLDPGQGER